MSNSPEVFTGNGETGVEAQKAAAEQSERLKAAYERGDDISPEAKAEAIEQARHEAKEALMNKERSGAEKKAGGEPTGGPRTHTTTKKQKDAAYKKTLKDIRSQMNAPSRTFSKVIHNPAVEKTSEIIGATIARPNAIVAGSATALVLVSAVYIVAKTYGYPLSGFETIGAFIIGWMIGLIYDYVRITASGGKQP